MAETKKVSPFLWKHPVGAEQYFEQLEREGWRIDDVSSWKQIGMKFYRAEPRQMRYTVHVYWEAKVSDEYIRAGQEQGWEFLGKVKAGRYAVWRKPYDGERPEPFAYERLDQIRERQFARAIYIPAIAFLILIAFCGIVFFALEGWQGGMKLIQNNFGQAAPAIGIIAVLLAALVYGIWLFQKNRT